MLLEARLMLSVGKRVWLDTALHTAGDEGSALTFRTDGIMIALEVARLVKGGSGRVNMRYRHALSDDVLARLPGTSCALAAGRAQPPAAGRLERHLVAVIARSRPARLLGARVLSANRCTRGPDDRDGVEGLPQRGYADGQARDDPS